MAKLMVNVHEAKTQLSRLIERALAGDEVVIDRPAALVSTSPERDDVILMRDPFKA